MRRVRTSLVIVEMTCCCLLVISAAILIASFRSALRTQTGQHLAHAILATAESEERFARPDLGLQYFRDIEQAAEALPQTVTTAWSGMPPGSRPATQSVRVVPPYPTLRMSRSTSRSSPRKHWETSCSSDRRPDVRYRRHATIVSRGRHQRAGA